MMHHRSNANRSQADQIGNARSLFYPSQIREMRSCCSDAEKLAATGIRFAASQRLSGADGAREIGENDGKL